VEKKEVKMAVKLIIHDLDLIASPDMGFEVLVDPLFHHIHLLVRCLHFYHLCSHYTNICLICKEISATRTKLHTFSLKSLIFFTNNGMVKVSMKLKEDK